MAGKNSFALIIKQICFERIKEGVKTGRIIDEILQKYPESGSRRTLERYVQEARKDVDKQIQQEMEAAHKAGVLAAVETSWEGVISRIERMKLLSQIALGDIAIKTTEVKWNPDAKAFQQAEVTVIPNHTQRISAVRELNEMDGAHAPKKKAATKADGSDVPPPEVIIAKRMDENQVKKILKEVAKIPLIKKVPLPLPLEAGMAEPNKE